MRSVQAYIEELENEREFVLDKHKNLCGFITKITSGERSENDLYCPLRVLCAQADVMRQYISILDERILIAKSVH